jgi:hypothetical protein
MKVGVLQQFLRSLIPALEAANSRTANDVDGAIKALEPFQALDVTSFAAFLALAQAYQEKGTIAVPSEGQRQVERLAIALERLNSATGDIGSLQQNVADALQALAATAGLKGKLSADSKWAEARALQARLAPHRKVIFELAARIASPEAFDELVIRDGIAQLAERLDAASLKALALEHGVKATAKAQPVKTITDVLAKLSGHQPPKVTRKSKAGVVDPAVVEENARRLTTLIERSLRPDGVNDDDVDAELARLKTLSLAVLYEVVVRCGMREARPSESKAALLKRVQQELTAARRARERAEF